MDGLSSVREAGGDVAPGPTYTEGVSEPRRKPKEGHLVPHPDDEAEVRAGLEEAERGDVLSERESADYMRGLLAEHPTDQ